MAEYLVRASALEGYNTLVESLGGDPASLRNAAGIPAGPLAQDAYLAHPEPENLVPFRKVFDCPVIFDAEVGMLTFPADVLQMQISDADSHLHQVLQEHLAQIQQSFPDHYPDQVRYLIRQALLTGDCSVERGAGYLSITTASVIAASRALASVTSALWKLTLSAAIASSASRDCALLLRSIIATRDHRWHRTKDCREHTS